MTAGRPLTTASATPGSARSAVSLWTSISPASTGGATTTSTSTISEIRSAPRTPSPASRSTSFRPSIPAAPITSTRIASPRKAPVSPPQPHARILCRRTGCNGSLTSWSRAARRPRPPPDTVSEAERSANSRPSAVAALLVTRCGTQPPLRGARCSSSRAGATGTPSETLASDVGDHIRVSQRLRRLLESRHGGGPEPDIAQQVSDLDGWCQPPQRGTPQLPTQTEAWSRPQAVGS